MEFVVFHAETCREDHFFGFLRDDGDLVGGGSGTTGTQRDGVA